MNWCGMYCFKRKKRSKKDLYGSAFLTLFLFAHFIASAQDVDAALNDANTRIRGYFNTGSTLMYAVGGVLGLIGAVKVYQKWNGGDPDTSKVAAAWFGSCIFLVLVATVIRAFFGL